jgi:hypothetical protein
MSGMTRPDQDRLDLNLLLRGFQVARILRVAADLGIADRISTDGGVAVTDLATTCKVDSRPLLRILRALAAFGIFRVSPDGVVSHSPRSKLFRTDTPNNLHHAARFWTTPGSWAAWGVVDAALSGRNPHQEAWKMSRFDYLRLHPEEARAFDTYMAHFPDNRHAAVTAAYDFSAAQLIVDIAGGNGETLRHILSRFRGPRGLVFDRPDVVHAIEAHDLLHGRITAEGGNFLDTVPSGGDYYLIMRVLHNWGDEDCLRILRNCRAAMRQDARLLIAEHILDPDPTHGDALDYLLDIQMMAMFGEARERTESEYRELLSASGLIARRVLPTQSPVSIIEATPA